MAHCMGVKDFHPWWPIFSVGEKKKCVEVFIGKEYIPRAGEVAQ